MNDLRETFNAFVIVAILAPIALFLWAKDKLTGDA